jgi:hypothetical protein
MPLAATAEQIIQSLVGNGYDDVDFQVMLEVAARGSGLQLEPENVYVDDGLSPVGTDNGGARTTAATPPQQ